MERRARDITRQSGTGLELHAKLSADIGILLHNMRNDTGQVLQQHAELAADLRTRREAIKRRIDKEVADALMGALEDPVATRQPELIALPPATAEAIRDEIELLFEDGQKRLRRGQIRVPHPHVSLWN